MNLLRTATTFCFCLGLSYAALAGNPETAPLPTAPAATAATADAPATQVLAASRATAQLVDILRLSTTQAARVAACSQAELRDLSQATEAADRATAERRYLVALGRILTPSQFVIYCALRGSLETPQELLQGL